MVLGQRLQAEAVLVEVQSSGDRSGASFRAAAIVSAGAGRDVLDPLYTHRPEP